MPILIGTRTNMFRQLARLFPKKGEKDCLYAAHIPHDQGCLLGGLRGSPIQTWTLGKILKSGEKPIVIPQLDQNVLQKALHIVKKQ